MSIFLLPQAHLRTNTLPQFTALRPLQPCMQKEVIAEMKPLCQIQIFSDCRITGCSFEDTVCRQWMWFGHRFFIHHSFLFTGRSHPCVDDCIHLWHILAQNAKTVMTGGKWKNREFPFSTWLNSVVLYLSKGSRRVKPTHTYTFCITWPLCMLGLSQDPAFHGSNQNVSCIRNFLGICPPSCPLRHPCLYD